MGDPPARAFVDLHCHSSASFDSLSDPLAIVRTAARRGLTHVAITDHERLDGALRARDAAPEGIHVIVGEEIRTRDGDLIGLYLETPVPPLMSRWETMEAIREQGGLCGIPHPFDRFRASGLKDAGVDELEALADRLDYVEAYNSRVPYPAANERAADFARRHGIPGVAASDAHTAMEVGNSYTVLRDLPEDAAGMRRALVDATIVTGRTALVLRTVTPAAKLINRMRGNRRIWPAATLVGGDGG